MMSLNTRTELAECSGRVGAVPSPPSRLVHQSLQQLRLGLVYLRHACCRADRRSQAWIDGVQGRLRTEVLWRLQSPHRQRLL